MTEELEALREEIRAAAASGAAPEDLRKRYAEAQEAVVQARQLERVDRSGVSVGGDAVPETGE